MLRPNTFICMNDGHLKMIGNGQGHHNSLYVAQRNASGIYSTSNINILPGPSFLVGDRPMSVKGGLSLALGGCSYLCRRGTGMRQRWEDDKNRRNGLVGSFGNYFRCGGRNI